MEGKAKEEMLKWLSANYPLGWKAMEMGGLRPSFQNTLIIEWLDSESIYISISTLGLQSWFKYEIQAFYPLTRMESFAFYRTRQGATEAAIKKAVEIFNEKNENNGTTN
ncbi:hypothetical protein DSC47_10075 [Elizabethkingia miricola]|uniref:hypothetical protein n=1 Tax=Elizabethkingia bruuniana TaxID=1756149 RepID=UPI0009990031|nr:hypothetical protein [Elizabethkingia bruuniana]OPC66365.1 hypothetical protein BAY13_16640 [Elizabethkingia bruuniana]RBI91637.1 hypothetical protein DSC47_10075 [Elizabethkingia miricola]